MKKDQELKKALQRIHEKNEPQRRAKAAREAEFAEIEKEVERFIENVEASAKQDTAQLTTEQLKEKLETTKEVNTLMREMLNTCTGYIKTNKNKLNDPGDLEPVTRTRNYLKNAGIKGAEKHAELMRELTRRNE